MGSLLNARVATAAAMAFIISIACSYSPYVIGSVSPALAKLNIASAVGSGETIITRRHPPANAIDGDLASRWTVLSMPQWIILDLGKPQTVNKTRLLMWANNDGRDFSYSIEASLDQATWTTVISNAKPAPSSSWSEAEFSAVEARYIRVSLDSTTVTDTAHVYQVEVLGGGAVASPAEPEPRNTKVTLTWRPNPGSIDGYIVYFGPDAASVSEETSNITAFAGGFNPMAPVIQYDSWFDLQLSPGDQMCFKLRAYNSDGLSDWSKPVCSVIPASV